jgi:hypothetical protein
MIFLGLRIAIGLLAITTSTFLLIGHYADAQTIPIPEFKPRAPEGQGVENGHTQQQESEPEPPRPADFAMKVQLEPDESEFAFNPYQV